MYMSGQGGVADINEARNWLQKAAEQGNNQAADALRRID